MDNMDKMEYKVELVRLSISEFNSDNKYYDDLSKMICHNESDDLMNIIYSSDNAYLCLLIYNDRVLSVIRYVALKNHNYIDLENGSKNYIWFLILWLISSYERSWSVFVPRDRKDLEEMYISLGFENPSFPDFDNFMIYH